MKALVYELRCTNGDRPTHIHLDGASHAHVASRDCRKLATSMAGANVPSQPVDVFGVYECQTCTAPLIDAIAVEARGCAKLTAAAEQLRGK